jgi:hypothetical protein
MKFIWAATLVFSFLIPMQNAEAAFTGCYERVYDKRYLRKHRKQDVVKMRLQIGVGQGTDGPFELLDRMDAGFRDKPVYRGNLVRCETKGKLLACAIEGEGGSFTVTDRGRKSLRVDNKTGMRFGDGANAVTLKPKGDHRQFRLFRISTGACP